MSLDQIARALQGAAARATEAARNEEQLRHELENALEKACHALGVPWTPYQLDRTLLSGNGIRFADVIHGAVIIEYEPPKSFKFRESGSQLTHARKQAEEYAELTSLEEGRGLFEYDLVVWDGATISFGKHKGAGFVWNRPVVFNEVAARNLLNKMQANAAPLVSPSVLKSYVGLDAAVGQSLVPLLFKAIVKAEKRSNSRTDGGKANLLFREWRRIFGQAVGINTDRLETLIARQASSHGTNYQSNIPAYLFSLHTYLALVAKLVAALALPSASQDIRDNAVALQNRIDALEDGRLFEDSGITNMLVGDFFSWPTEPVIWSDVEEGVQHLLVALSHISFDLSRKNPTSVRDLFKGVYEVFIPRELRHALGEVYTPDWLAEYVLDRVGWDPNDDLLDPTCGTGTFILEALKRRLASSKSSLSARDVLRGVYGFDLNPLAVLAAKASIVVTLSSHFDPDDAVTLPVFLADAINVAVPDKLDCFHHTLQTELGPREFVIPAKLARSELLFPTFWTLRRCIAADMTADAIWETVERTLDPLGLTEAEEGAVKATVVILLNLHELGWDGIWCAILADRFAAGAIRSVSHIIGNPPWVKWSHLPPEYANFIKPLCKNLNAFSEDRYVGGIESDISTIITMQAIQTWLKPKGTLAFLITATLFSNESSQGFRRMMGSNGKSIASFKFVEDFKFIAPFDGVTNHPSLMVLKQGGATNYPIPYRVWEYQSGRPRRIGSAASFLEYAQAIELQARPVPGTDSGPWLKGSAAEQKLWTELFDGARTPAYKARKGITTDLNGVFFIRIGAERGTRITVRNDPSIGRTDGLPVVERLIEHEHIFPLIRGRGLQRFQATTDPHFKVIVPQRGMHGDFSLPRTAPHTYRFFEPFKQWLESRGSYRRYQKNQPFWSIWSTGAYTFAPFKVLWKEMSGSRFCAAYVGSEVVGSAGRKIVVPDHKLYFVPVKTKAEAQYLTGILNARTVARAIGGYAAQLSLGVSVIEYLKIPKFDKTDIHHQRLAELADVATLRGGTLSAAQESELDSLAMKILRGKRPQ